MNNKRSPTGRPLAAPTVCRTAFPSRLSRLREAGLVLFSIAIASQLGAHWPGETDPLFQPDAPNGSIYAAVQQEDGRWVVAGDFTQVGAVARNGIARLNGDGTVDETFADGLEDIGPGVRAIAVHDDGKLLAGGAFGIVRLDSDGALDESFGNTVLGTERLVAAIAVQPDGKILIGGSFTHFNRMSHIATRNRIARLHADGTLDDSFGSATDGAYGANDSVFAVAIQDNGKVLIGGDFTGINGEARGRIARLHSDGSLDSGFGDPDTGLGADDRVNDIVPLPGGQILIAGRFGAVNGEMVSKLARLNDDGSLDGEFYTDLPGGDNEIHSMARQSSGKFVIGGEFSEVDSLPRGNVARVMEDGQLDETFGDGLAGTDGTVLAAVPGAAGRILIGGEFGEVNELPRDRVAVLHGGEAPPFRLFLNDRTVAENQPDGAVVGEFSTDAKEGVPLTFTLVSGEGDDGNADFSVENNALKTAAVFDYAAQNRRSIRVRGTNTTGGFVEEVFEIRILAYPDDGGRLRLDPSFDPGASINGAVTQTLRQSDGKWIVTGFFTAVHEAERGGVARLNPDGSTDHTFMDGMAGANAPVRSAAIQDDGKILIGGYFSEVNGKPRPLIARLHPDGSLDETFAPNIDSGTVFLRTVRAIAVQDDGRILIGGRFFSIDGEPRTRIARLNPDGSLDPSFGEGEEGVNDTVAAIAVGEDGQVWIGGYFSAVNGESRRGIARLHPDGSLDGNFGEGLDLAEGIVFSVAPLPDGKVLIGGAFHRVNGQPWNHLARLYPDGTLDTSFGEDMPRPGNSVHALKLLEDGMILVGGAFHSIHGETRSRLARLHPDGAVDTSFGDGLSGVVGPVSSIAADDAAVVVGGSFTGTRPYVARLDEDGELDETFANGLSGPSATVRVVTEQSDGKILIGGSFRDIQGKIRRGIARLHPDGALDEEFGAGLDGAGGGPVRSIIEEPDGRILIAGNFNTVHREGRSRVARLHPDGTLDSFAENLPWLNTEIRAMARQPDGKVVVGGNFQSIGEELYGRIARLNTDGSLDTGFADGLEGADDIINAIAVQPDGRILIGGRFAHVHGEPRGRIARLHPDGSLDTSFGDGLDGASQPIFPPGNVSAIAVHDDGKILIGGNFSFVNGESRNRLARLNPDGTLDDSFLGGIGETNNNVFSLAVQVDGRILVGGAFTTLQGEPRNRIARLRPDGSLDLALGGADSSVYSVSLQDDANVLIAGNFRAVNGVSRTRVARLFGGLPPWHGPPTDILLSNNTVPENRPSGRFVGELTGVGPDEYETYTFELVAGEGDASNNLFSIEEDQLVTTAPLDYETSSAHPIRVRATDVVSLSTEKTFVIEVEQNSPPTDILLSDNSAPELENPGWTVGTLTALDPDEDDLHTFELAEGEGDAGNSLFTIEENALKTAAILDYYEAENHTLRVRATDLSGASVDKVFSIEVVQDAFRAWAETLPEGERGPGDDPGDHGIPNIYRYAFGMDPVSPEREKLPKPGIHDRRGLRLTITYTQRTDDDKLVYTVEASHDLEAWETPRFLSVDYDYVDDDTVIVTVADPHTTDQFATRFLRVRVDR